MQECTNSSIGTNVAVCGSDGITYPNRCEVISRQCQGASILIKHTGPCPGKTILFFYFININANKSENQNYHKFPFSNSMENI